MIATDITGNAVAGGSQLLDLLKVVANPAEYEKKIQQLQTATDEYNKVVSVVGAASEIPALRAAAEADRIAAADALGRAKAEAEVTAAEAKAAADALKKTASASAQKTKQAAESTLAAAQQRLLDAEKAQADLAEQQTAVEQMRTSLEAQQQRLELERAALAADREEATALRAALKKKLDDIAKAADL